MIKKLTAFIVAGAITLGFASNTFAYEVEKGDTMHEIAKDHNLSLQALAELNPNVANLDLIYIGDTINTGKDKAITVPKSEPKEVGKVEKVSSSNEVDLLARLVYAEANGESYRGKVAVANVVLNRVESKQFPDTITGVIYQAGQFSPVTNGSINNKADSDSLRAVHDAISNRSDTEALFFYNPKTANSRWLDGKSTVNVIGNHTFKK